MENSNRTDPFVSNARANLLLDEANQNWEQKRMLRKEDNDYIEDHLGLKNGNSISPTYPLNNRHNIFEDEDEDEDNQHNNS